jgi:hypothetical protein
MKISRYRAGLKRFIPFRQCVASEFAIVLAFECVAWAGNRRGRIKLEKAQEEDHFSLEQVTARSTKRADAFLSLCHQAFALVPVPVPVPVLLLSTLRIATQECDGVLGDLQLWCGQQTGKSG